MGLFSSFGFGGSTQNTNYNRDFTQNTTQKPILDPRFTGALDTAQGNIGQFGYNPTQAQGINYFSNYLNNPGFNRGNIDTYNLPVLYRNAQNAIESTGAYQHGATDNATNDLSGLSGEYALVNQNALAPVLNGQAPQSAGTSGVTAQTGAAASSPYMSLLDNSLIQPSLDAFDYGTAKGLSALDARTAAGGAFANSRSQLPYNDFLTQAAYDRAQLGASLRGQALNSAFGYGQTDASRGLQAATTNAANTLNNNQFNVGARQADTAQKLQAANQWSGNVGNRVGISNQILANQMGMSQQSLNNVTNALFTSQGFDANAAQNLVNSGAISFDQLMQIVGAWREANGMQTDTTGHETGHGTTNKFSFDAKI